MISHPPIYMSSLVTLIGRLLLRIRAVITTRCRYETYHDMWVTICYESLYVICNALPPKTEKGLNKNILLLHQLPPGDV